MEERRSSCYLCGGEFAYSAMPEEYIIPFAVGGRLQQRGIVCDSCSKKINRDIDSPFAEMFAPFLSRMPMTRYQYPRSVVDVESQRKVRVFGGMVNVGDAWFDEKSRVIYAPSQDSGEDFKDYLEARGITTDNIPIYTELSGWIEEAFYLHERLYHRALARIAVAYAAYNGIRRDDLYCVIDFEKQAIVEQPPVSIYVPDEFGQQRSFVGERDTAFPMHWLILRGDSKRGLLYAYIELFSTFSGFVFLNDRYRGDDLTQDYIYSFGDERTMTSREYYDLIRASRTGRDDPFHYDFAAAMQRHERTPEFVRNYQNRMANRLDHYISSSSDLFGSMNEDEDEPY